MINALPDLTTAIPKPERGEQERADIEAHIREALPAKWRKPYLNGLKDDLNARRRAIGSWKHCAPVYDSSFREYGASALFMVRNPYSWADSLFRRPYGEMRPCSNTIEAFLTAPWLTMRRDQTCAVLHSPVELWRLKLEAFLRFQDAAKGDAVPCAFLRFEEFVADPVSALSGALALLGVDARGLQPVEHSTKAEARTLNDIQTNVSQEKWRDALSREAVETVNRYLPEPLLQQFGYKRLEPDAFASVFEKYSDRERGAAATG